MTQIYSRALKFIPQQWKKKKKTLAHLLIMSLALNPKNDWTERPATAGQHCMIAAACRNTVVKFPDEFTFLSFSLLCVDDVPQADKSPGGHVVTSSGDSESPLKGWLRVLCAVVSFYRLSDDLVELLLEEPNVLLAQLSTHSRRFTLTAVSSSYF